MRLFRISVRSAQGLVQSANAAGKQSFASLWKPLRVKGSFPETGRVRENRGGGEGGEDRPNINPSCSRDPAHGQGCSQNPNLGELVEAVEGAQEEGADDVALHAGQVEHLDAHGPVQQLEARVNLGQPQLAHALHQVPHLGKTSEGGWAAES